MPSKITTASILPFDDRGEQRVFKAADQHGLVDHRVFDPPQAADALGDLHQARRRSGRHEQGLEVRPMRFAALESGGLPLGNPGFAFVGRFPFAAVIAIAARRAASRSSGGSTGPRTGRRQRRCVPSPPSLVVGQDKRRSLRAGAPPPVLSQLPAGRCRPCRSRICRPALRLCVQLAPTVEPGRRGRKEVIETRRVVSVSGHHDLTFFEERLIRPRRSEYGRCHRAHAVVASDRNSNTR